MATMTQSPHRTPDIPGPGQYQHHQHHHQHHPHHPHHQNHQHQHHNLHVHPLPHEEPMNGTTSTSRIVPIPAPAPTIHTSAPPPPGDPMDITTPTSSTHSAAAAPRASESYDELPKPVSYDELSKATLPGAPYDEPPKTTLLSGVGPAASAMPAPPPATAVAGAGSAAAAPGAPKIVQTAFIHKLYGMLEDHTIQHLIRWTPNGDSFVMQPTADFSKVLAQYFKHTNISSFVRQLNMYGFHKVVNDVFNQPNGEPSTWEFKHGAGNFRRGDQAGLREIRRRASRHALANRDYSNQKPAQSQPGTPAEPAHMPHAAVPESVDARLASLEHAIYDLSARLQRSEENAHYISMKNQAVLESVTRLSHLTHDLSRDVMSLAPQDGPVHRKVINVHHEIGRSIDILMRSVDDYHEPPFSGTRQYLSNMENPPVSPRQLAQDDPRRSNLPVPPPRAGAAAAANNFYRPPISSNLAINTRRPFGSIGGPGQVSPLRNNNPPVPPPPPTATTMTTLHPLAAAESPSNLPRRHTSADIRAHWHTQQPQPPPPPPLFVPTSQTSQWPPPSPSRLPGSDDLRVRDSFSTYNLQAASPRSRPITPTLPPFAHSSNGNMTNGNGDLNAWSFNSAWRGEAKGLGLRDLSAPSTRRGSMAHILNPSDTAERDDEDMDPRGEEDRKRKRVA